MFKAAYTKIIFLMLVSPIDYSGMPNPVVGGIAAVGLLLVRNRHG